MKKLFFCIPLLMSMQKATSCPTCVGRIKADSKPFFETESSQKEANDTRPSKKFLTAYEQYLQQKKGKQ